MQRRQRPPTLLWYLPWKTITPRLSFNFESSTSLLWSDSPIHKSFIHWSDLCCVNTTSTQHSCHPGSLGVGFLLQTWIERYYAVDSHGVRLHVKFTCVILDSPGPPLVTTTEKTHLQRDQPWLPWGLKDVLPIWISFCKAFKDSRLVKQSVPQQKEARKLYS